MSADRPVVPSLRLEELGSAATPAVVTPRDGEGRLSTSELAIVPAEGQASGELGGE